jgi:hypothetical protein
VPPSPSPATRARAPSSASRMVASGA